MANRCAVCDKKPQSTFNVSKAHNRTKRWVYPNVHTIRYRMKGDRSVMRGAVCTKCLKGEKVEKVV